MRLHAENDKLRLLIQRLMRHQFGRRSEQLSPDQLQFGLEELEQSHRRQPGRAGDGDSHGRASCASRAPSRRAATTARYRRTCRATRW